MLVEQLLTSQSEFSSLGVRRRIKDFVQFLVDKPCNVVFPFRYVFEYVGGDGSVDEWFVYFFHHAVYYGAELGIVDVFIHLVEWFYCYR